MRATTFTTIGHDVSVELLQRCRRQPSRLHKRLDELVIAVTTHGAGHGSFVAFVSCKFLRQFAVFVLDERVSNHLKAFVTIEIAVAGLSIQLFLQSHRRLRGDRICVGLYLLKQ